MALRAFAGASALEAMQKLVKDQNQALAKAQLAAEEAQAKARSLQEQCQSLEEDTTSSRCEPGSLCAVSGNCCWDIHRARAVVFVTDWDTCQLGGEAIADRAIQPMTLVRTVVQICILVTSG